MAVPIVSALAAPAPRAVALTFDDGPSPNTPGVLEVLAAHDARATFFILGQFVERHPEVLTATAAAGHELGNHSWTHPRLHELSEEAVRDELGRTAAAIEVHTGGRPRVLRCPYGSGEGRVAALVAQDGSAEAVVHWSVDPEDWDDPPSEDIVARVLAQVHPGAIVCMHDGYGRAGTVEALRTLVPALVDDGYALVTVSELLALGPVGLA